MTEILHKKGYCKGFDRDAIKAIVRYASPLVHTPSSAQRMELPRAPDIRLYENMGIIDYEDWLADGSTSDSLRIVAATATIPADDKDSTDDSTDGERNRSANY